nr:hypothetical protein [Streptococcus mitis]MBU6825233.1 hypothetical protein [Streptococcus mitis]
MRTWAKSLSESEKRIVSGVEKKLYIVRFIRGRFTSFSPAIEFLHSFTLFKIYIEKSHNP